MLKTTILFLLTIFLNTAYAGKPASFMPPHPDLLKTIEKGKVSAPPAFEQGEGFDQVSSPLVFSTGTKKALVILVDFSDRQGKKDSSHYAEMLFSKATYITGSLRDYYSEVSGNKIDIQGSVATVWVRVSQPSTYYTNSSSGCGTYPKNAQKLVAEAVALANNSVDFSQYDLDHNGSVDILFVICAGSGNERTGSTNDFRSHAWGLNNNKVKVDRVFVDSYTLESEDSHIGTFCHELGHLFGLPDMYDDTYSSKGVGDWSLMGAGAWCGPGHDGTSPSHLDVWSKAKLNWVSVVTPTKNQATVSISPAEGCYKLWTNGQAKKEYFLVENRQKTGFDTYLPGQGLLIYHVNELNMKNNANRFPYFIAVEQADGKGDLEKNVNNGDDGDPWPGSSNKNIFDTMSIPNSKDSSGKPTFVAVTNISLGLADNNITASLIVEPAATISTGLIVSGFVFDANKKGTEGVLITLEGNGKIATTTTNSQGFYEFGGLTKAIAYTITPSISGYAFNPSNKKIKLSTNLKNQNFTAIPPAYSISGKIRNAYGQGIVGVSLTLSGASKKTATTKADGSYGFSKVPAGNYQLTPAKKGYNFILGSITYSPLNSNQAEQNFEAIPPKYTLSGYIFYKGTRKGMGSVTITISAGSFTGTTVTDDKGYYQFIELPAGAYQLTPSYLSGSFSPKSKNINLIKALPNQNFFIILPRSSPDYMDVVELAPGDKPYVYPNPYLPSLHTNGICFVNMLPDSRIRIYTLAGELVTTIEVEPDGIAIWSGKNDYYEDVASGIYFYAGFRSDGMKWTGKIGIVR